MLGSEKRRRERKRRRRKKRRRRGKARQIMATLMVSTELLRLQSCPCTDPQGCGWLLWRTSMYYSISGAHSQALAPKEENEKRGLAVRELAGHTQKSLLVGPRL